MKHLRSSIHSQAVDALFDDRYLSALKDQDSDAENFLIAHFSRPVQLKLRTRLRSPGLVEDASQETFLRVFTYFRSGKTINNPASLPGFVHSVCHNVALEFLRAHTRQSQIPENAAEPADISLNPEGQMVAAQREELVARVLGKLREKDRQLIRWVLDEEDKDAVCNELQVDRGYLRVLLHRARIRFRSVALRATAAAVN